MLLNTGLGRDRGGEVEGTGIRTAVPGDAGALFPSVPWKE